ncbi:sigma-54 interaction domain-containing protein [Sinanaerobacter chloroacetimidivorans]|uniref:Sigma 54-interacting transcriptional regulator n=1 Tax=Sinanaerobacter chloroacetimidivorans TaxID=2818044 RepID=A0A8J8B0L8_9FIRM|nr:sigma 54-interacting transcriptional regulator [Sinanaerobacter chloroacetimidivorans]MBR0597309.1 sigma 54-interacting transcriptional regulator [Sinanaerobacter chloroacetimidivorans]
MQKLEHNDFQLILEHVTAAVAIDLEGNIIYMNEQCAEYLGVNRNEAIGKRIIDIFPETKMMQKLLIDKAEIVFYNTKLGIGISVEVPIFKGNERVGLLEYDVAQSSELLYDFADEYKHFLDEELKHLKRQIRHLRTAKYSIQNIVGNSEVILKLKDQIISAAKTNSTVLITGETGTGKELVAHAIHSLSPRRNNDFIRINAAALPETLAESELFGYEAGSFTGATKEGKKGKFELADKGTLFIDEINQMPDLIQPKLLRALQEKEIEKIGGKSIPVDTRIICASNKDLEKMVKAGTFREDLYYRINVVQIHSPALREHLDDLEELANAIVFELNSVIGTRIRKVEPAVIEMFSEYHWPGNIRELHNIIERAMNYVNEDVLKVEHFEFKKEFCNHFNDIFGLECVDGSNLIEEAKRKAEKELIVQALKKFDNNVAKTATFLSMSRPLLYQKMKRLKIEQ